MYEAIADYAKRVQRGEKPMGDEKDVLLPEDNDDYVLDDWDMIWYLTTIKISKRKIC